MKKDTTFRIDSMTKPITAVAALLLVEEKKLDLDAPVAHRALSTDGTSVCFPVALGSKTIALRRVIPPIVGNSVPIRSGFRADDSSRNRLLASGVLRRFPWGSQGSLGYGGRGRKGIVFKKQKTKGVPAKGGIRWTLVVLLWAWAVVIFVVIDLFLDVEEFDGIRPRVSTYRGMRRAGHELVGTAYRDPVEAAEIRAKLPALPPRTSAPVERRGRVLHRYLPRGAMNVHAKHGGYTQWTDPPGKGQGQYENEMRHGTWVWSWPSGVKREQRVYQRGVLNGNVTCWYENGQRKASEEYRSGKPVNGWKTWHSDGTLASEEWYEDGALHGDVRQWHANGQPAAEAVYEHGVPLGKLTLWYDDGRVKETGRFADGKRDGVWTTYSPGGELVKRATFTAGKKMH
jgi:antitoxin component YwqK of YwqJK toxin-antitoxin module